MEWQTPYEVVRKGKFWNRQYEIHFEEIPLITVTDFHLADQLVALLNGAFNMGRESTRHNPIYLLEDTDGIDKRKIALGQPDS